MFREQSGNGAVQAPHCYHLLIKDVLMLFAVKFHRRLAQWSMWKLRLIIWTTETFTSKSRLAAWTWIRKPTHCKHCLLNCNLLTQNGHLPLLYASIKWNLITQRARASTHLFATSCIFFTKQPKISKLERLNRIIKHESLSYLYVNLFLSLSIVCSICNCQLWNIDQDR